MVKRYSSFLKEDFSNWQKSQAKQQKQQEELRERQEMEARRAAEWIGSRPIHMKALDVILPGQQFRTPPPPPKPVGFGDFRLLEGSSRSLPGSYIGPLEPGRNIAVPEGYGQPPKPLLPGKLGQFESRVMDIAARTAAPGHVPWETPTTGNKIADVVADVLGTGLGFLTPGGAAGKVMNLAEAAAQAGAARVPAKMAQVATPLARGVVGGAAFGGMEAATEGKPLSEIAKRAAEEAAYWTGAELGFGVAIPAAAKGLGKVVNKIKRTPVKAGPVSPLAKEIPDREGKLLLPRGKVEPAPLPPGQEFTYRDLTPAEITSRVLPERPLALPAPRQDFTLVDNPLQFKTKAPGPVEKVTAKTEFPIRPEDRPLVDYFRERNISLRDAAKKLQDELDKIVNRQVEYLKSSGGKGVEPGGLVRDPVSGEVVNRFGRISNNPQWYREFYANYGRAPRQSEYRELAIQQLRNGFQDDTGIIPPDEHFLQVEALLGRVKRLQQELPEDIIQPRKVETPQALPAGQDFTLQGEPLQFKTKIPAPLEKGPVPPRPPAEEPPLRFKQTVAVPRGLERQELQQAVYEATTPPAAKQSLREVVLAKRAAKAQTATGGEKAKAILPQEAEAIRLQTDISGTGKTGVEAMAARPTAAAQPSGSATATEKTVSRKVMIDRLTKALDLPTRVGRINIPKALGIFKRREEVIRTKLAEDLPVITHEVGHHLDKVFSIRETVTDQAMIDELINLGKTQPAKHFTEGIAEFMRHYLTGDDAALKQAAPKFYEWFENTVRQEPRIWDALQQFRQDYKDYMTAPAKARVKAAISVGERQHRKVTIDRIMEAVVDDLRPIDSFVQKVTGGGKARKGLAATEDPFIQAWLFRGWTGKARNAIWYGVRNKNGEKVAPGLMEILKPVAKDIDDFRAYIVSRRAIELHARGKETGLDPNDVKQVVAELDSPEFRQAFEQLKQYQDAILDRLVESGIISAEQKAVMRQLNQEYVPFYRVFDPNAGGVGFGKRGFGDLSVPIKRLKGSGRTIVDPLESIIKNTYYMTNLAERNNVGRTLVDFANKYEGMGKFVEQVDPKVHPISFNLGEIKRYLEQVGVDMPPDALQEVATIFRPNMTGSVKENILTVWRNGKPELYQLDPDLYRAVLMLDHESTNTMIRLLSYPASWLRAGAVLNPEFAIRNVMRDAFGSWVFSKYGFVPGLDTVRGLFHVIKRDDLYQQWLEGGGAGATLVSLDRAYLQEDLRKLLTKDIWQKMKMYARHPLEVLRVLSEFSEEATRVGEFAKGLRAETRRGVPMQDAIQRAALASRDITLDFSRAGTVGRPANQLIAFFNASVQGIDKTRRAFKDRPLQTTLKVLPLTLASIALWAQNYDKPEYQQLPQWRKDLFWNFVVGDHIVSIPKPFELGVIFASLPERILDWANGVDPEAISKWANSFKENVTPNWIPTALVPIIEVMTDYSFFQGRPITPMGEKYLLKQEQYGPTTTEAAKNLSRLLAAAQGGEASLSPREIETLVRGYTGGLGMHGMAIASAFMPKEYTPPAKDISEYPVVKAVVSRPFQSAEGVNDFYDRLEELEKKARTAKKLQEAGKPIPASLQYDKAELRRLRRASDALAELRKQKDKVLKSALSPEEKRAKLDAINIQSINIAQKALGRPPVQ